MARVYSSVCRSIHHYPLIFFSIYHTVEENMAQVIQVGQVFIQHR